MQCGIFSFTSQRIGSEVTGYASTKVLEQLGRNLDLPAAVAVSGAAVSSNMGSRSVAPMAFTLAFLNLRLGYWLPNPALLASNSEPTETSQIFGRSYLVAEALSRLDEKGKAVYITDGGRIENLGIYALLKKRCRVIVAVNAEADQSMRFPSLIALQRYARIDLGVRIHLPWEEVRDHGRRSDGILARKDLPANFEEFGKHVAIGKIEYAEGVTGWLVCIKASLSGDEGDAILDYKRRKRTFPHETTGDQFFREEQFEVYRALGFHIAHRLI